MTRNRNSAAWAWIIANAAAIRRVCDLVCKDWRSIDPEDFHHAVLVRLVDRWDDMDPERAPMAWVRWQAMAARKSHHKALLRKEREAKAGSDPCWDSRDNLDSTRALEAQVDVSLIRNLADPEEWAAVVAKAEGRTGSDLQAALGCAPFSATRRIRRLAQRLGGFHVCNA